MLERLKNMVGGEGCGLLCVRLNKVNTKSVDYKGNQQLLVKNPYIK